MTPIVGDGEDVRTVTYPEFDHGDDLFVLYAGNDLVEFQTGRRDQFVRTDTVVDLRDVS